MIFLIVYFLPENKQMDHYYAAEIIFSNVLLFNEKLELVRSVEIKLHVPELKQLVLKDDSIIYYQKITR